MNPYVRMSYYTVCWDYIGGDCGDLPWKFFTVEEALACGADWVTETMQQMQADGDDTESGCDGWPVFHVFQHLSDGSVVEVT